MIQCFQCSADLGLRARVSIVAHEVHPTPGPGGGIHVAWALVFCNIECLQLYLKDD